MNCVLPPNLLTDAAYDTADPRPMCAGIDEAKWNSVCPTLMADPVRTVSRNATPAGAKSVPLP
jgi:hypothetical protein